MNRFKKKHRINGIIRIIDGTHIAITNVRKDTEHMYVNRKGWKSINTQIVSSPVVTLVAIN